ncbi:MAG: hypothetical protein V3S55_09790, partial [Nitrospiraceae bacterium]
RLHLGARRARFRRRPGYDETDEFGSLGAIRERAGLMLYDSEADDLTITLGGDIMLTRSLKVYSERRFTALAEIRIHPIDQGFGRPRAARGRPMLANGAVAKRVFGRMAKISKIYGTTMGINKNTGIIRVPGAPRRKRKSPAR